MTKNADVEKGDAVEYKWGSETVEGKVTKVHTDDVTKTIKGNEVTRKATETKPAVEIKTDKGQTVLKSTSEVKISSD